MRLKRRPAVSGAKRRCDQPGTAHTGVPAAKGPHQHSPPPPVTTMAVLDRLAGARTSEPLSKETGAMHRNATQRNAGCDINHSETKKRREKHTHTQRHIEPSFFCSPNDDRTAGRVSSRVVRYVEAPMGVQRCRGIDRRRNRLDRLRRSTSSRQRFLFSPTTRLGFFFRWVGFDLGDYTPKRRVRARGTPKVLQGGRRTVSCW